MNIQINLLPEAKLTKLRNKSKKRFYASIATASVASVSVAAFTFVLLYGFLIGTYRAGEEKTKSLKADVAKSSMLEEKATTLQENLASFYQLNANRTTSSLIFVNLFKVVPSNVKISSVGISGESILSLTGTTDDFKSAAVFVKSLEQYNVDYLPQPGLDRKPIFTNIDFSSVSKAEDGQTSFSITAKVDQSALKPKAVN